MNLAPEERIEELIRRSRSGDTAASEALLSLLYSELHAMAGFMMGKRPTGMTLQPTALVHEAWMKLHRSQMGRVANRKHFMNAAATAMRSVLVDHYRARGRRRQSSNGQAQVTSALDEVVLTYEERALDLEALDAALKRLATFDERMTRAVELRFFGGLSVEDTAAALGMSLRTFEREWAATTRWLLREIS